MEAIKREIKFRFWNKELKRMSKIYGLGIIWESLVIEWGVFEWKNIDSLQYTGLKDKNGKEICEGDIVIGTYYEFGGKYKKVEFNLENAGFDPFCKPSYGGDEWDSEESEKCEIIGNIYENPALEKLI